ncbi:hypothetical protein HDU76_009017, partial [Blyttiomyces sp. JEL0837]
MVKSFAINQTTKQSQVNAIKSYFNLYPYLDIANGIKSPYYPSSVNLFGALDALVADNNTVTEYDFQAKVTALVNSLNDGQAQYLPTCFSQMLIMQPFVIAAQYNRGAGMPPQIYIRDSVVSGSAVFTALGSAGTVAGNALNSFWATNGVGADPASFKGYIVTGIDGMDPVKAIQAYADTQGVSRDPNVRFNNALFSYIWGTNSASGTPVAGILPVDGSYYMRLTPFSLNKDSIAYTLVSPAGKTVTVNATWAAVPLNGDIGQATQSESVYYSHYCTPQTPSAPSFVVSNSVSSSSLSPVSKFNGRVMMGASNVYQAGVMSQVNMLKSAGGFLQNVRGPLDGDMGALTRLGRPLSREDVAKKAGGGVGSGGTGLGAGGASGGAGSNNGGGSNGPVAGDANGAFYNLDGTTGVWVFPTVAPQESTTDGFIKFAQVITNGLATLEAMGVKQLVIDVSNNGGGVTCLGQALIRYLFPQQQVTYISYDVRLSKPMMDMLTSDSSTTSLFNIKNFATTNGSALTDP